MLHLSSNPRVLDNVTLTETPNGITIQGSPSISVNTRIFYGKLPLGDFTLKDFVGGSNSTHQLVIKKNNVTVGYVEANAKTITVDNVNDDWEVYLFLYSGNTDTIIKPQMEVGSSATSYEPYSNICPISGRTETSVVTRNEDNTDSHTATISFGQTVYGGQVDFKTGVVTVERGYIASYNGETLPGEWISDRDVYASGTTPTTGAQVAYELATPTTLTLTPDELTMIKGDNSVTGDGVITITALTGDSWS